MDEGFIASSHIYKNNLRYTIHTNMYTQVGMADLDFVIDTGAYHTVCSYDMINNIFPNMYPLSDTPSIEIGGVYKGLSYTYYQCIIPELRFVTNTFSDALYNIAIWVTFDTRLDLPLLGTDLLQFFHYRYDADRNKLIMKTANKFNICKQRVINNPNYCIYPEEWIRFYE